MKLPSMADMAKVRSMLGKINLDEVKKTVEENLALTSAVAAYLDAYDAWETLEPGVGTGTWDELLAAEKHMEETLGALRGAGRLVVAQAKEPRDMGLNLDEIRLCTPWRSSTPRQPQPQVPW